MDICRRWASQNIISINPSSYTAKFTHVTHFHRNNKMMIILSNMNFWYQLLLSCFFFNASRNHDPSALSFWFTTNLHCLLGVCIVVAFRYRQGGLLPIDKGDCQVEQWNHKSSSSNCKIRRVMQTAICTTHGYQAGTSLVAHTSIKPLASL